MPAPVSVDYSESGLNRAARFFPWVGLVLGILCAAAFWGALQLFGSVWVAVIVQLIAGVLFTGAFHEDGLADYCDSFGGQDKQSRLAIMTDSRLGTYGVLGLLSMLALRVSLLVSLPVVLIPPVIIFSATVSRLLAVSLMLNNDYVKVQGKSKPLATQMELPSFAIAGIPALLSLAVLPLSGVLVSIVVMVIFHFSFAAQLQQRLGGYTGDCLGAAQQFADVLLLASLLLAITQFN